MQADSLSDIPCSLSTSIDKIRQPVQADFYAVNRLIIDELCSDVPLIQEIVHYILQSGGKRLRALLVLLSAKASGYQGSEHEELAAVIEFIHTATLLHDDVIDRSKKRRGKKSVHILFGNQASVLVGDFLYSRAFQLLAKRSNVEVTKVLATTVNLMAEGEVLQLIHKRNLTVDETWYFKMISYKTAELFKAAAHIGAIIATDDIHIQQAMKDFGYHLGIAYQIVDDVLDYQANPKQMGKNLGEDLAEGKPTLPLIYAIRHSSKPVQQWIQQVIQKKEQNPAKLPFLEICQTLEKSKAYHYCYTLAEQSIQKAKDKLALVTQTPFRTALELLADFVLSRHY